VTDLIIVVPPGTTVSYIHSSYVEQPILIDGSQIKRAPSKLLEPQWVNTIFGIPVYEAKAALSD
jgi:hypothetical protein